MSDVLSLGELLIDFSPAGFSANQNTLFEQNPGGAPANVAVQLARLGISSAFVGKVGNDEFGKFLKRTLDSYGVITTGLKLDDREATTLAFVQLSSTGDRSFSFYRNPGADTQLCENEIDFREIDQCRLVHFGSLLFTNEPSRSTVLKVLAYAKKKGKIISYDPNWRPMLWKSAEVCLREMRSGIKYYNIIKVSDEELFLITDCNSIDAGTQKLLAMGAEIVAVTFGARGCCIATAEGIVFRPAYDIDVVDTTGAGDSFFAAFLYKILSGGKPLRDFSLEELAEFAEFSNASGAVCASKTGAIPAMPSLAQIQYCVCNVPPLLAE
jgi:fructokinase